MILNASSNGRAVNRFLREKQQLITPMSLFQLTPDKLGSLICKRISRLTLFARARWHMELQPQKAGHTHGDTHAGRPSAA